MRLIYTVIILFYCLVNLSVTLAQDFNSIDSLQRQFITSKTDSARLKYILEIGDLYYEHNPDSALYYYEKGLKLSYKILKNDSSYFIQNKYAEALYSNGYILNGKGIIDKALNYYIQSLKIREQIKDSSGIAYSLLVIGNVFLAQDDVDKAMENYTKCALIFKAIEDLRGLSIIYNNLGYCFSHPSYSRYNNDTAITYFKKCITYNKQINDLSAVATSLNNLGMMYYNLKEFNTAIPYFEEAILLLKPKNDLVNISLYLKNLGSTFDRLDEPSKAIMYYEQSYKMAKQSGFPTSILHSAESLYQYYKKRDNNKTALSFYEEYVTMKDSVNNDRVIKTTIRQQTKYEFEKEQLLKEQKFKVERRKWKEETERRDNIQYSVIFIAILAVFGTILSLGFIKVSPKFVEGLIFFAFLIFFEFCLVLLDPYVDNYSGGEPAYKLLFNAVLAGAIFPVHAFFENKLKVRILKNEK